MRLPFHGRGKVDLFEEPQLDERAAEVNQNQPCGQVKSSGGAWRAKKKQTSLSQRPPVATKEQGSCYFTVEPNRSLSWIGLSPRSPLSLSQSRTLVATVQLNMIVGVFGYMFQQ